MLKDDAYNALINMIWSGQIQANKIYSVTKIAKDLNISRSYVSRIEKRAITKILREFIKNKEVK